jgi:hypothetical protein
VIVSTSPRVFASGQPIATAADLATIAGCVNGPNGNPLCAQVKWTSISARIFVNGSAALFQQGHVCVTTAQVPTGSPILVGQTRAVGT